MLERGLADVDVQGGMMWLWWGNCSEHMVLLGAQNRPEAGTEGVRLQAASCKQISASAANPRCDVPDCSFTSHMWLHTARVNRVASRRLGDLWDPIDALVSNVAV